MRIASTLAFAITASLLMLRISIAQEVMSMGSIREMCGPKWGHREFVDQTECILRVLPQSNNPDLVPANPYIGWYTEMASKMIDDVRNKRVSEVEARENVQQAFHEVYVRQLQAASDLNDQEAIQRKQVKMAQDQARAEADARRDLIDNQNASLEQARLDRFCASAAQSVQDTCSITTKNPKVAAALCVTARILYAKQGCI
jgi:hypothetical protein